MSTVQALRQLQHIMGFVTSQDLYAFGHSTFVREAFDEFVRNFLGHHMYYFEALIPFLNPIMESIADDQFLGTAIYSAEEPDTQTWGPVQHYARFIARVHTAAVNAGSSWAGAQEEDMALWGWQLLELLIYLSRSWIEHCHDGNDTEEDES